MFGGPILVIKNLRESALAVRRLGLQQQKPFAGVNFSNDECKFGKRKSKIACYRKEDASKSEFFDFEAPTARLVPF